VSRGVPIIGSVDSHAWDAWEFASSEARGPNGEKPGFPDHCVKGTPGWLKVTGTLPPRFRFLPNVEAAHVGFIIGELIAGAQALTVTVPGRGEFPLPCPRREVLAPSAV